MLTNLPEGTVKIGLVRFDGQPMRVWWALPADDEYRICSTNLEGTDLLQTQFYVKKSDAMQIEGDFPTHPLYESARRLRIEDGTIWSG